MPRSKTSFQVHRLLTIAGPGGIGKTTLALALANECASRYRQGVVFVDLTPIAEGSLAAATLASALDVPFAARNRSRRWRNRSPRRMSSSCSTTANT